MRNDIQGLRAFAVLSVIIYHVAPLRLPGGFIGVDIFFVISGYLIISSIVKNLDNNNFSFKTFYNRRLTRLAPVYLVVTVATAVLLYNSLLTSEYDSFSKSVAASFAYASNFWFYTKAGYFDSELLTSPLLHTWSLSVEEQFYLVIPGLLYLTHKAKLSTKGVLLTTIVVSLAACIAVTNVNQPAAFYFSPLRFWQFMIGGYAALYIKPDNIPKQLRDAGIIICTAALVLLCFIMEHADFPGWKAILPTFLTAIILALGTRDNFSYKLIGSAIPKYIGDISYSLYLWHWPLIVYFSVEESSYLAREYKIAVIALTFVLSILSYHTIENPLRRKLNAYPARKNYLTYGATCTVILVILLGATNYKTTQSDEKLQHYEKFLSYGASDFRNGICFLSSTSNDYSLFNKELCNTHTDGRINILLVGDSHAAHWYPAMKNVFPEYTTTQVTSSGCKPVLETTGPDRCTHLIEWAYKELITNYHFDKILISARWVKGDEKKLKNTVNFLANHADEVIILGPTIEYNVSPPRLLARGATREEISDKNKYDTIKSYERVLTESIGNEAKYVSVLDAVCPSKQTCILTTPNNTPLQFDYGHLTSEGAIHLMQKLSDMID